MSIRQLADLITYVADSAQRMSRSIAKYHDYKGDPKVEPVPINEMREELDDIRTMCDSIESELDEMEDDIYESRGDDE